MASARHRALRKPRHPLASYLLSFTYLVLPLIWITGIAMCFFISQFFPTMNSAAYFPIFVLWVFGIQMLLALLIVTRIRSGVKILILRKWADKASSTSAKIAQPFATYGHVETVFGSLDSNDGFIFSVAVLTHMNMFLKAISGPAIARHVFDNNKWMPAVANLIKKADIVVIDILHGTTQNISWEIDQCQQQLRNHRIVFLSAPECPGIPPWAARITLRPGWPGSISIRLRREVYRVMRSIAKQ